MWGAPRFKPKPFAFFMSIKHLPTINKLETTLYADSTHVSYACDSLEKMETEINLELQRYEN